MLKADRRFLGSLTCGLLVLASLIFLAPADGLSQVKKGKGKGTGKDFIIVTGTITKVEPDDACNPASAVLTFTKTNDGKKAGTTEVTIDGSTKLLLNDDGPVSLAAFIAAVNGACPPYSGSARIEGEDPAAPASRVSVSNAASCRE